MLPLSLTLSMNLKVGLRCSAACEQQSRRRGNAALPTQWFMGAMSEILFRRNLSPSDGEREKTWALGTFVHQASPTAKARFPRPIGWGEG